MSIVLYVLCICAPDTMTLGGVLDEHGWRASFEPVAKLLDLELDTCISDLRVNSGEDNQVRSYEIHIRNNITILVIDKSGTLCSYRILSVPREDRMDRPIEFSREAALAKAQALLQRTRPPEVVARAAGARITLAPAGAPRLWLVSKEYVIEGVRCGGFQAQIGAISGRVLGFSENLVELPESMAHPVTADAASEIVRRFLGAGKELSIQESRLIILKRKAILERKGVAAKPGDGKPRVAWNVFYDLTSNAGRVAVDAQTGEVLDATELP